MPEISIAKQMPCWHFDAQPGVTTLDMLAKRGRGVKIELVTHSNGELSESDFEAFGKQCGKFTKTICGICHDRFIIVDQKEIFWTGALLKDAGRLTFAAAKVGEEIILGLLESIRKATTVSHEYSAESLLATNDAKAHKSGVVEIEGKEKRMEVWYTIAMRRLVRKVEIKTVWGEPLRRVCGFGEF